VSVKTTEVVCSTDCVEALLGAANSDKGEVSVAIGDADPVPLSLDNPTKLAVGSKDTVLKFSVKASGGKETIINVPVTHSASIPETTDGSSGTPLLLIIAIVLAVALLAGAGLVIRKRNA
jgi:LPXTG-motif cell wall-anchored protein